MKKRFLCLFLTLIMMLGLLPSVAAANDKSTEAAQTMYELGLFRGTGTNADGSPIFDLDKTPTRNQAIIMLVRLLGKEEEALAGNWKLPFTDVAKNSTSYAYIGYAYANGLTNGTSATTYSGKSPIRANQYITFVLRALGYISGEDFKVSTAWEFSDAIGLTNGEYNADNAANFIRADVAKISESALSAKLKGSNIMLLRKLYNQKSASIWAPTAKTKKVSALGLPAAIGKTTLTYEDAYALLGKDPAVIADAVKTVGDMVQYMIAANFNGYSPGTFTPWYGNGQWGFDPPGKEGLRQNYGTCCAGNVNVALYLLKGDYEEQGVIRWMGGGNHTIAYVRTGGKYYVFDPTEYRGGKGGPITVLNQLEDYYENIPTDYPKAEMTNVVAFKDTDVCYPWGWHSQTNTLIFPTETKDHVIQLYQKNPSATVSFKDVSIDIPMWNTDKLDAPATNIMYDTYEVLKEKYAKKDISLLFDGGLLVQENQSFRMGLGHKNQVTVLADGRAVSAYSVKSSDPSVCDVYATAGGKLNVESKQNGSCTLYITYQGKTAAFYYHTAP